MRIKHPPTPIALILVCIFVAMSLDRSVAAGASSLAACEGDACQQIVVTYDDAKQQYRAQNNSSDRWARVSASNLATDASVCVGPGKAEYLPLKSIVGAYRAAFSEVRCGVQGGAE